MPDLERLARELFDDIAENDLRVISSTGEAGGDPDAGLSADAIDRILTALRSAVAGELREAADLADEHNGEEVASGGDHYLVARESKAGSLLRARAGEVEKG